MLEARQAVCGYHRKPVVEADELTVRSGEIVLLLGPNGSGKSTLMKSLIGALPLVSGTILLDGKSIGGFSPSETARLIGYVPQSESSHFSFSVREMVLMGRLPYASGMFESEEDHAAAEEAMELAGCAELADRPVTELSGGENQRVLIARSLAQKPRLLALDEPASHFDIAHSLGLMNLLETEAAKGMAVLAVVHDLSWAAQIESRAYLLSKGKIVRSGPTLEVIQSPEIEAAYGVRIESALVGGKWAVVPRSPF